MMTLPNILTFSRIALIPLMAIFLYIPFNWAAWIALSFYIIISITDFFDGYLARAMKQVSPLGTFLDPIADKILIATTFLILVDLGEISGFMLIPVIAILVREFMVSGLREFLGPRNVSIPVTFLAKCKTAIQMIAIGFLIIGTVLTWAHILGLILLTLAMLITIKTGYDYLIGAWPYLTAPQDQDILD
jgi:cardiolipin synthase (CMP-forming)